MRERRGECVCVCGGGEGGVESVGIVIDNDYRFALYLISMV